MIERIVIHLIGGLVVATILTAVLITRPISWMIGKLQDRKRDSLARSRF